MPVTLENGGKNEYVVKLVFTEEGGEKFRDITQKSIGETLYIYVDGSCVSAPVINSVIASGEVYISGISSYEDAKELAALIQGDESVRN